MPAMVARPIIVMPAQEGQNRFLRNQNEDHEGDGIEGRQARRQPLHDQRPDQDDERQDEMQPGQDRRPRLGQFEQRAIGVVQFSTGTRDATQSSAT
jgi:hypothetical protein